MLISVAHLLDRSRHQRRRADELRELRQRMVRAQRYRDPELVQLARRLRRLRSELAGRFGAVQACSKCARGHPLPYGFWPGGHCCGGRTEELFPDDELAALTLGGTSPYRLRAPRGEQAGCVFRSHAGCSLSPEDRPNLCVRYTCRPLEAELAQGDAGSQIAGLQAEILETFSAFRARRRELMGTNAYDANALD